jgi:GTPase SAR1 family protein
MGVSLKAEMSGKMKSDTGLDQIKPLGFSPQSFCGPGLIEEWQEISPLSESILVQLRVFHCKKQVPALWVVLLGGTGTGKSTIFNVLCGRPVSETGVERPKTTGPILYGHEGFDLQEALPFPEMEITVKPASEAASKPTSGFSGRLLVVEHNREDFSHIILADTPDLDSVDLANRTVAENLYHLSDAVIFVASQEKYADEVPYLFLLRVLREKRLCYFILNKAGESSTGEDVLSILREANVSLAPGRIWLFPYALNQPTHALAHDRAFHDFQTSFLKELSKSQVPVIRKSMLSWHKEALQDKLKRLTVLAEKEQEAAREWLKTLHRLEEKTSEEFVREQQKSFLSKNQDAIKGEIRRLFSKYDVLAKPRQLIRETILFPLRFLGLVETRGDRKYKEDLRQVRRKIDLVPIRTAVEKFNHLVLETLSPADEKAPLFEKIRNPGMSLTPEEVKDLVWKAQDQLDEWLAKRFESLAASLPRTKRWGIYSTSMLWGILIVSLEVAVGGGFTILDALLGSALAPFVTKGTVEVFAFHEIQKVTRELAVRYQKGLLSVIQAQEERYEQCLQSLLISAETREDLRELTRQAAELSGE